jgi:hypothetical protein
MEGKAQRSENYKLGNIQPFTTTKIINESNYSTKKNKGGSL